MMSGAYTMMQHTSNQSERKGPFRLLRHCEHLSPYRHPEVAASLAALEGRRPGCSSGAVHPSRLAAQCKCTAQLAPPAKTASPLRGDDGVKASLRSQRRVETARTYLSSP